MFHNFFSSASRYQLSDQLPSKTSPRAMPDATKHCNKIVKGLYVGNITASKYHSQEFNLIVNCSKHIPISSYVESVRIPVDDSPDESTNMYWYVKQTKVLDKMKETIQNGGKVLVHCHAGQQRSCALVACYLMKEHHLSPEEAVLYIQSKRKVAFFGGVNFVNTLRMFAYEALGRK